MENQFGMHAEKVEAYKFISDKLFFNYIEENKFLCDVFFLTFQIQSK